MSDVHRRASFAVTLVLATFLVSLCALDLSPDGKAIVLPNGRSLPDLCLVRATTGESCPSCGLGRSVVALAHGRPGESRHFHPGGILLAGWIGGQLLIRLLVAATRFSGPRLALVDGVQFVGTYAGVMAMIGVF